jgi:hypothetical protein
MSKSFTGKIASVSATRKFIKDGKEFRYRIILFDVGDSVIAANYWSSEEMLPVGTEVKFVVKISSEKNNKNPDIYFHKINLISVYELHNPTSKIQ